MKEMSPQSIAQQSQTEPITQSLYSLADLQKRFNNWRMKRKKRGVIPEELWDSAVRAVQENPPGRVSRVLGLNYLNLKKRVEEGGATQQVNRNKEVSKFVEFDIRQLSIAGIECVVEVEEANGAKMKVQIKNASSVTPMELVRVFLERSR
ncbi:hypothetical protein [Candidatus Magnetobacterium casense]|uniref:Uncharacterized protein n=1 Tax=Candidatus Magnetobacterium casense TaxID=1455061 RepID=A0ABS6S3N0_9BACT|nr:hypothetical protein [Candidatus Magnetobacterium casensis]MBV6343441.1 hypothetical protein [Candidatus Magnetobacterium casensis]